MQLSKNFTLEELTASPTADKFHIKNTPSSIELANLKSLCDNILQPLRDKLGEVKIDSGFRCDALNTKVGSKGNSQHLLGLAADIQLADKKTAFEYIRKFLPFDQLIWEYGDDNQPAWIHVSFSPRNRRQVLRKKAGEPYKPY